MHFSSDEVPRVAPQIAGYAVHHFLGSGAAATVWRAYQESMGRDVAIKVLHPYGGAVLSLHRFAREAEIMGALSHENVVAVYDSGQDVCGMWLAMELVDGQRLDLWLADSQRPLRDRVKVFAGICAGIRHTHQRGVVHRDLKPGNVLVNRQGIPKITDFGLAAWTRPESLDLTLTRQGEFFGSPVWMPPEQARGKMEEVDTLTDIHALGAILFFLLSGRPPLDPAQSPQALLSAAQLEDRPRLRDLAAQVPRDLGAIADKCLSGSKARRYQSASEVEADVLRWLDGRPVQARPVSELSWVGRKLRHHWVVVAAACAVIAAGTAWVWERFQAKHRLAEERRRVLLQSQELAGQLLVDLHTLTRGTRNSALNKEIRNRITSFRWDPESGDHSTDARRFVVKIAMADARALTAANSWTSAEREWTRAAEELLSLLADRPENETYLAEWREVQLGLQTVLLKQRRRVESVVAGLPLLGKAPMPENQHEPSILRATGDAITNLADALCGHSELNLLGESSPDFPADVLASATSQILAYAASWYHAPEKAEEVSLYRHRVRVLREAARVSLSFDVAGTIDTPLLAERAAACGRRLVALAPGEASNRLLMRVLATQADLNCREGRTEMARALLEEAAAMVLVEPAGALSAGLSPGPALQLAGTLFRFADHSGKWAQPDGALWAYAQSERIWKAAYFRSRKPEYLARRGAAYLEMARILVAQKADMPAGLVHARQALELLGSAGEPYLNQNPHFNTRRMEAERFVSGMGSAAGSPDGIVRK
jgi:tRNA A-37 threonylcarbamoyl transferase component Bud32